MISSLVDVLNGVISLFYDIRGRVAGVESSGLALSHKSHDGMDLWGDL